MIYDHDIGFILLAVESSPVCVSWRLMSVKQLQIITSEASFHKEELTVISIRKNLNIWTRHVSDSCFPAVCLPSGVDRGVVPVCGWRLSGPTKPLRQRSHVRNHESAVGPPAVCLQMPARIRRWDIYVSLLLSARLVAGYLKLRIDFGRHKHLLGGEIGHRVRNEQLCLGKREETVDVLLLHNRSSTQKYRNKNGNLTPFLYLGLSWDFIFLTYLKVFHWAAGLLSCPLITCFCGLLLSYLLLLWWGWTQ